MRRAGSVEATRSIFGDVVALEFGISTRREEDEDREFHKACD